MSTLNEPSSSNVLAMKETFVNYANTHKMKHSYDFIFYYADKSKFASENGNAVFYKKDSNIINAFVNEDESIYRTFEKTYHVLNKACDSSKYDFFVRLNISSFLNIGLLDAILETLDEDVIYCNAINSIIDGGWRYTNEIYPRGDMFIMSSKVWNKIQPECKKLLYNDIALKDRLDVAHVDDVLLGIALVNSYGTKYIDMIKAVNYLYLPYPDEMTVKALSPKAVAKTLCCRVKTVPPNETYSGYSWDDNKYRRIDGKKMKILQEMCENNSSSASSINQLLTSEDSGRPTLIINAGQVHIKHLKEYLKTKKRGD